MNVYSTSFLVGMINTAAKRLLLAGPVVQTLVNEVIAFGKPLEKVLVVNIVHRDMKVLIAACEWRIILELPIDSGDDVRDIAVFQGLCASETDEPEARN